MARDSHLDKLGDVPLFSACSRKDLQKIAKASDEVEVVDLEEVRASRVGHVV